MKFCLIRRSIKHTYQKLTRGFSDKDLWHLDHTIAVFVLPRLKVYKEINGAYPGYPPMETPEKWGTAMDEMIFAMQLVADEWTDRECTREDWKRCHKGIKLFGKWFRYLWY